MVSIQNKKELERMQNALLKTLPARFLKLQETNLFYCGSAFHSYAWDPAAVPFHLTQNSNPSISSFKFYKSLVVLHKLRVIVYVESSFSNAFVSSHFPEPIIVINATKHVPRKH